MSQASTSESTTVTCLTMLTAANAPNITRLAVPGRPFAIATTTSTRPPPECVTATSTMSQPTFRSACRMPAAMGSAAM